MRRPEFSGDTEPKNFSSPKHASPSRSAAPGNPSGVAKVLYVGGAVRDHDLCRTSLRSRGISAEVLAARNIGEAASVIDRDLVDLVIVDEHEFDSRSESLRRIARPGGAGVVLVGPQLDEQRAEKAFECGAEDFLIFGGSFSDDLAAAVTSALRHQTAARLKEAEWSKLVGRSSVDGLTHLPNQRSFEESLARRIAEYQQDGKSFALLLIRLDGFEKLASLRGSGIAESVLSQTAEILKGFAGARDIVARLSQAEFAFLQAESDVARSLETGDRICQTIREHSFQTGHGAAPTVTASIGLALESKAHRQATAAAMLAAAHGALTRAESQKGDRLCLASPIPTTSSSGHLPSPSASAADTRPLIEHDTGTGERRATPRWRLPGSVPVIVKGNLPARLIDISQRGAQIELSHVLHPKERCDLRFRLSGRILSLRATVRRCRAIGNGPRDEAQVVMLFRAGLQLDTELGETLSEIRARGIDPITPEFPKSPARAGDATGP